MKGGWWRSGVAGVELEEIDGLSKGEAVDAVVEDARWRR